MHLQKKITTQNNGKNCFVHCLKITNNVSQFLIFRLTFLFTQARNNQCETKEPLGIASNGRYLKSQRGI